MFPKSAALALAACIAVIGCRSVLHRPIALKDAPAPSVPNDWTVSPTEPLGYTVAFPGDWHLEPAQRETIEQYVNDLNSNAWTSLGEKKADVNFETAQGIIGVRSLVGDILDPNGLKYADQKCLVLKEALGRNLTLDDAAARWFDTMKESTDGKELKKKPVELPVGLAESLTKSHVGQGMVDRTSVYCLVDGQTVYTFFFEESATDQTPPIPILQIMQTFRLKR